MGGARFSSDQWTGYAKTTATKSQQQIFTSSGMDDALDPSKFDFRESCDSAQNPESTPLMVFVDETGSMGVLATTIIKKGLGVIMTSVYDRMPIKDPHVLVGGIGDAYSDRAPLQASQFEADVTAITSQIEKIYIEGNGGGNGGESYLLAWYFAAFKTKTDSMIKRGKKGYLFTVGDEEPHRELTKAQIKTVFGDDVEADFNAKQLYDLACESWEVFHLKVNPGSRFRKAPWVEIMGERVIDVSDHEKLAEVIVSTMQIIEGHDKAKVTSSWDGSTNLVVADAVKDLVKRDPTSGVVAL